MKKNYTVFFAVIAALIALCAFWGCSSSDDDDGPPEGFLGNAQITLADGEQVYKEDGSNYIPVSAPEAVRTSNNCGASYGDSVAALSSIDATGKLVLKLPVITNWSETLDEGYLEEGTPADPSDVRVVLADNFRVPDIAGKKARLKKVKGANNYVIYTYADKDAHVWGESDDQGTHITMEMFLKRGWNVGIASVSGSNETWVNGSPGDGYKWTLFVEED
jgi:hypothetical protein